jgi:hypothetical protein
LITRRKKIILTRDVVCDEDKVGFQYVTDQSAIFDDPFPICSKAELDSESFILTIEQLNGESIGFAL